MFQAMALEYIILQHCNNFNTFLLIRVHNSLILIKLTSRKQSCNDAYLRRELDPVDNLHSVNKFYSV
jgi:hypothetical protein